MKLQLIPLCLLALGLAGCHADRQDHMNVRGGADNSTTTDIRRDQPRTIETGTNANTTGAIKPSGTGSGATGINP
jgi:hypothetical protein